MSYRRRFVLAIGATWAGYATAVVAQTATSGLRRVAVLTPSTRSRDEITLKPFYDEMARLGWVEGQNILYDRAFADDRQEALLPLALELAGRQPDVIHAPPSIAAVAARQATRTIPIVFTAVVDPVGLGLVASLAHPGGNATGTSQAHDSLLAKELELLLQILPNIRHIALLGEPGPSIQGYRQSLLPLVNARNLRLTVAEVGGPDELAAAIDSLHQQKVETIFSVGALVLNLRARFLVLTLGKGMAVIGQLSQLAEAGALFSYGPVLAALTRRSAVLVDKVLRGSRPADLPVEQPNQFELVVNLKTAKALGVAVPKSILLQANKIIE